MVAGMNRERRVAGLEARAGINQPKRTHWLRVNVGHTMDEARAEYEARHGAINDDDMTIAWIVRTVVDPAASSATPADR